jgi:predicted lipoprotein
MWTVIAALTASGHRMARKSPTSEAPAGNGRRAAQEATQQAVEELFEPERDQLRLPKEKLTSLFLATTRAPSDVDIRALVDVFLNGALTR